MDLYCTDISGKYTGLIIEANINPKYAPDTHNEIDKYIYNKNISSLIKPMEFSKNECVVLENNKWVKKVDRINQNYYAQDGQKFIIEKIGIDIPSDSIQEEPPTIYHDTHNGIKWIENTERKKAVEEETIRIGEIDSIIKSSELNNVSIGQAINWIDKQFDNTTDTAETISAIKLIFKKMIPYLLK